MMTTFLLNIFRASALLQLATAAPPRTLECAPNEISQQEVEYPTPQIAGNDFNPYPDKPRLHFRPDGTFKITVFSDLHYGTAQTSRFVFLLRVAFHSQVAGT
jgi:hypothetical protein